MLGAAVARFPLDADNVELFWFAQQSDCPGIDPHLLGLAVQTDRLDIRYQPQLRMSDGTVIGFEALARWHHPTLGEIAPDVFIPLAERTGQIDRIGAWILRRGLREFASLRAHGAMRLAANVSPLQLRDPGFADLVATALADAGQPAANLELEITETVRLGEDAVSQRAIAALQDMGVALALDDFGTGYSNFSTVATIAFSRLELDRALIAGLLDDRSKKLIGSMRRMAQDFDMELLVEGIGTLD